MVCPHRISSSPQLCYLDEVVYADSLVTVAEI